MEYEKMNVSVYRQGNEVTDPFYLDDDYNVPDTKKDVKKVLLSEGAVKIEGLKQVDSYLRASGQMQFRILYLSEEGDRRLESLEGSFPFEEMVYVEEPLEERPFVKRKDVDITVTVIHSRKLNVKALVELAVCSEGKENLELTRDVTDEETLHKKFLPVEFLRLAMIKRDTYRIKEEVTIAGTKEAVGTLLWTEVKLRKLDTRVAQGQMLLQGELSLFTLYESLEGKTDWVIQSIPFEGQLELPGAGEEMYHQIYPALADVLIDLRMDEDGEMRVLGVEATLEARMILYEEIRTELVDDVYALASTCQPVYQNVRMERALMQNHSKCKLNEQLHLPEIQNDILQICHSSAKIQMENIEATDSGIAVDGVVHLWFLYVKADDDAPFDVWQGMVPFSHLIESNECEEGMRYDLYGYVEQISINLLGNAQVEVKAVLSFQSFLKQPLEIRSLCEVTKTEIDRRQLEKAPGVIGYMVKEGDELWNLAKHFRTTTERILESSQKTEETLKVGEKLLIFKENVDIL